MNLNDAIIEGTKFLQNYNIYNPLLDSEILLSNVIKKDREYLILNSLKILKKEDHIKFKMLLKKRSLKVPVAYLIKKKNFWKDEFYVDKRVLIPRPDSELLVSETLQMTKNKNHLNILEVGVGSGCIILSILKEKTGFKGNGIDIDKNSLDVSKLNAKKLGINDRIKFFKYDIDKFNIGKYDIILSNPPYISKYELSGLVYDVIKNEPKVALDGGIYGTSEIKKVIKKSSKLLKHKGKLILEISYNQKNEVKKLFNKYNFYVERVIKDFANYDRCVIGTKI